MAIDLSYAVIFKADFISLDGGRHLSVLQAVLALLWHLKLDLKNGIVISNAIAKFTVCKNYVLREEIRSFCGPDLARSQ